MMRRYGQTGAGKTHTMYGDQQPAAAAAAAAASLALQVRQPRDAWYRAQSDVGAVQVTVLEFAVWDMRSVVHIVHVLWLMVYVI